MVLVFYDVCVHVYVVVKRERDSPRTITVAFTVNVMLISTEPINKTNQTESDR